MWDEQTRFSGRVDGMLPLLRIESLWRDRAKRDAYLRERNPELVILTGPSREPPSKTRDIHGRPYVLAQSFPMGENYWWLFVREDARIP